MECINCNITFDLAFPLSHWYDSTPKKSRRKRDSNPGSSALEADALPLGQGGGVSINRPGKGSTTKAGIEAWSAALQADSLPQANKAVVMGDSNIQGSQPEWCSSSIIYSTDTPFWSETLGLCCWLCQLFSDHANVDEIIIL